MRQYEETAARRIIQDINDWEVQSIKPSTLAPNAWAMTIGSTPRIVGDLLPDYVEGSEDGIVLSLQPREGTAEFDETVQLRRAPAMSKDEGEVAEPGIVMWGILTCAYESRDRGTFEGTIAFYDDEAEGAALMATAAAGIGRAVVARALDEIDANITQLGGHGIHVVEQAPRILGQMSRLSVMLSGRGPTT